MGHQHDPICSTIHPHILTKMCAGKLKKYMHVVYLSFCVCFS
uniref:Uncharacterized protein n=1 Tax=Rhizophora mucronata TaxID=61149 RepID=A0A2P2IZD3_RHIMU